MQNPWRLQFLALVCHVRGAGAGSQLEDLGAALRVEGQDLWAAPKWLGRMYDLFDKSGVLLKGSRAPLKGFEDDVSQPPDCWKLLHRVQYYPQPCTPQTPSKGQTRLIWAFCWGGCMAGGLGVSLPNSPEQVLSMDFSPRPGFLWFIKLLWAERIRQGCLGQLLRLLG